MQRLRTILSITSVRLSLAYTVIFGLVAVVIVFYMTASTENILRRQITDSVNAELIELERSYDRGGINGLMRRLERSAAAPGANLYVVADPAGQMIAGNVAEIDNGVIEQLGWTAAAFDYVRFEDGGENAHQAVARIVELPNGMRLLVGRDIGEPARLREVVTRALGISLATMVFLGVATWVLVGRRAIRRLDLVSGATSRILAGDRSERLPVSEAGDEFDRLSVRLNDMLERIGQLETGLRQVSDNIAHDLKTPLTRLRNKADAALNASDAKLHERTLAEVIDDTDSIIRTFDALLMIARVESGSAGAAMQKIELSAIANDIAELYQPLAEDQGISFRHSVAPGVQILGNRELLSRALANLTDNAIKYGQPTDGQPPTLEIALTSGAGKAHLCVADNGPGIDAGDHERVIERFARLEQSRTEPGSGLGLSLVAAVAKLHGGVLEFTDNRPGLRACLILNLAQNR